MTLERRQSASGTTISVLTECPCGKDLSDRGGRQLRAHLLTDHTPADFGLTPLDT